MRLVSPGLMIWRFNRDVDHEWATPGWQLKAKDAGGSMQHMGLLYNKGYNWLIFQTTLVDPVRWQIPIKPPFASTASPGFKFPIGGEVPYFRVWAGDYPVWKGHWV